jgi:Fe-S-cluster containining protein
MEHYFKHQADLAGTDCNFQCPEECNAPGCCSEGIIIGVTLFDLMRLSPALDRPVSVVFKDYCRLGFQSYVLNPRYKHLLIKLKNPCLFLRESRCLVHGSKPLNCVLFPELHQLKGLLDELRRRPIFRLFPCLNGDIAISDTRKTALQTLRRMSLREEALSYFLLFGEPSFILDPKPFTRQLKRKSPGNRPFSIQDYDRILDEQLRTVGLFDQVMEQVSELDTKKARERLFEKLTDDVLIAPILGKLNRPKIVHRFKRDRIQRFKRRPQPLLYPDI